MEKKNNRIKNIKKYNKITKNSKNCLNFDKNSLIFTQISKDFVDWINGVEEDDPIKTEAKNIYFIAEFNQNDIVLSYSADERVFIIFDYGAYFPLEAEYFYSGILRDISKLVFEKKSIEKHKVLDMLKLVIKQNLKHFEFLKNRKIYFGKRFSKVNQPLV